MAEGKICRIEGCTNILTKTSGQVCQAHRSRLFRHGTYDISPKWPNLKKGMALVTPLGYMRININGKRVLHHRYIMSQHIGRELKPNERVHHINGIKTDNRIENLELFESNSAHILAHHHDVWRTRKTAYPAEDVQEIMKSISKPSGDKKCFCGKSVEARNLCAKHFQWAWKHKFT